VTILAGDVDARSFPCSFHDDGRKLLSGGTDETEPDDDLDIWYRSLSPWLRARLLRSLGTAVAEVDDIVQESFIRLGRYSPVDRSRHPRALLLRIAANLARDGHRRSAARGGARLVPLDDKATQASSAFAYPADQEFLIDLKRTVLDLPDHLRDTFMLARFTPMTHAEIAAHLRISTKTVEWRIRKAVSICLARLGS
jgi:RNA polymerase sigma factor (sigma-70 family)